MTNSDPLVYLSGPCLAPPSLSPSLNLSRPPFPYLRYAPEQHKYLGRPSQNFSHSPLITRIRVPLYIPLYPSPSSRISFAHNPDTREIPPITLPLYIPSTSAFHSNYIF